MPGLKRLLEHTLKDKRVHNTMNMRKNMKRSFCRQRLKCGVAQTTVRSQMETIGTGTKCQY